MTRQPAAAGGERRARNSGARLREDRRRVSLSSHSEKELWRYGGDRLYRGHGCSNHTASCTFTQSRLRRMFRT